MVCQPWPLDPSCLPDDWSCHPHEWTDEQRAAVEMAQEILTRLTAGQFGLCESTVRPCRRRCLEPPPDWISTAGGTLWTPTIIDGTWINVGCGCWGSCGCGPICEVELPGPIYDILRVVVDGVEVPRSAYTVHDYRRLVRLDGDCFPDCQRLDRPATEPGTWAVTYLVGTPVPPGGRRAIAALAVELWRACNGNGTCRLPSGVTEVVREGITMEFGTEIFEGGRTGLREVDMWLSVVNPYGTRAPLAVWSPDIRMPRRETLPRVTGGRR